MELTWLDLATKTSQIDRNFYDKVKGAKSQYRQVDKFVIQPYSGRGFTVEEGQIFRIVEERGPQIGVVAFWNARNPTETFTASRTMAAAACFIRPYSQLWSDVPWFHPMVTCLEDTVVKSTRSAFHYHSVGSHCSPETLQMRFGAAGVNSCRRNLLQAIEPFGLAEKDLHDNVNVHQKVCLDPLSGKILIAPSDAKQGDYIEFFVEMDLLVGVSVCPFGDGSADPTVYNESIVRPLGVEIYDTGIEPKALPTWADWRPTWTGRWLPPLR